MTKTEMCAYLDNLIYFAKATLPKIHSIDKLPDFIGAHFAFLQEEQKVNFGKLGLASYYARRLILLMSPGYKYNGMGLAAARKALLKDEALKDIGFLDIYQKMDTGKPVTQSEYDEYVMWNDRFIKNLDESEWGKFSEDEHAGMANHAKDFAALIHKRALYLFGDMDSKGISSAIANIIKINGWDNDMQARVDLMYAIAASPNRPYSEPILSKSLLIFLRSVPFP